jgi:hypothetical protein
MMGTEREWRSRAVSFLLDDAVGADAMEEREERRDI